MTAAPVAEGLLFDRLLPSDQDLSQEVMTSPEVRHYLGGPKPPEVLCQTFAGWLRESAEGRLWCLRPGAGTTGLGLLFLDWHVDTGQPEVSFLFPQRSWGQGLASRSVRALTGWAMVRHGTVCAETQSINVAARKVLERSGFFRIQEYARFGAMQSFYVAGPATG